MSPVPRATRLVTFADPVAAQTVWPASASAALSFVLGAVYTIDVRILTYRNRWKADAILLSVGAVYSLF